MRARALFGNDPGVAMMLLPSWASSSAKLEPAPGKLRSVDIILLSSRAHALVGYLWFVGIPPVLFWNLALDDRPFVRRRQQGIDHLHVFDPDRRGMELDMTIASRTAAYSASASSAAGTMSAAPSRKPVPASKFAIAFRGIRKAASFN
jgi:hypothetical protein